jgi:hypothetical protein
VNNASGRAKELLLAEDNLGDVRLNRKTLKEINIRNNLSAAGVRIEATALLRSTETWVPKAVMM